MEYVVCDGDIAQVAALNLVANGVVAQVAAGQRCAIFLAHDVLSWGKRAYFSFLEAFS